MANEFNKIDFRIKCADFMYPGEWVTIGCGVNPFILVPNFDNNDGVIYKPDKDLNLLAPIIEKIMKSGELKYLLLTVGGGPIIEQCVIFCDRNIVT